MSNSPASVAPPPESPDAIAAAVAVPSRPRPGATSAPSAPWGRYKSRPSDFVVTERPLYEPQGEGDHLWLWVRAEDIAHSKMADRIASHVGVPSGLVRAAGMKDRLGITKQWLSIPTGASVEPGPLDGQLSIEKVSRHGNGLKLGQLVGNRFDIVVRDVQDDAGTSAAVTSVQTSIDALTNRFTNHFGPQRFGRGGSTLRTGFRLLAGEKRRMSKTQRRLAVNAVQSLAFNAVVRQRLMLGLVGAVVEGDVVGFPDRGSVFVATEPDREQLRLDAGETVLTGPMPGAKAKRPEAAAAALESEALASVGLAPDALDAFRSIAPGTRRPLTVSPTWHEVAECESAVVPDGGASGRSLRLAFSLPAGSYATSVLDQLGFAAAELDD